MTRGERFIRHGRNALAAAVVAIVALPITAHALPPVSLSKTVLVHGDRLTVSGRDCPPSGLGNGYGVSFANGTVVTPSGEGAETGADGRWTASFLFDDQYPAGKWTVLAACYDKMPKNPYPRATFILKPGRSPRIFGPLSVSKTTVQPGDQLTVSGAGYGNTFDIGMFLLPQQRHLGFLAKPAQQGGTARGTVRLPTDLKPGTYRLIGQANHPGGPRGHELYTLAATITVPAPAPKPVATSAAPVAPPPSPTPSPSPTPAVSTISSPSATSSPDVDVDVAAPEERGSDGVPVAVVAPLALGVPVAAYVLVRARRRRRPVS